MPGELFFVFAEENSRFMCDTLEVDGTVHLCRETAISSNPRLDPKIHFALEQSGSGDKAIRKAWSAGPEKEERVLGDEHKVRRMRHRKQGVNAGLRGRGRDALVVVRGRQHRGHPRRVRETFLLSVAVNWGRDLTAAAAHPS